MPDTITHEQLAAMREWLADCVWADMESEDFATLPAWEVVRGIKRHFAGGIAGFLKTS